jgi:hypothetical protein
MAARLGGHADNARLAGRSDRPIDQRPLRRPATRVRAEKPAAPEDRAGAAAVVPPPQLEPDRDDVGGTDLDAVRVPEER